MTDRFEDDRGVIQDLLVCPLDSVTRITSHKGAIRGNHFHKDTTQWTLVLSGLLRVVTEGSGYSGAAGPRQERDYGPGEIACEAPGVAHAWLALEDTDVMVFTKGPRTGPAYETDTFRLETPMLG
jgi:quercetin dioxygenase-like cupin family protein